MHISLQCQYIKKYIEIITILILINKITSIFNHTTIIHTTYTLFLLDINNLC